MPGKRLTPEQIIGVLRWAEVELAQGRTAGEICRSWVCQRPASIAGDRSMAA